MTEGGWVRDALSGQSDRLVALVDRAIEASELSAADVFSLGDWLDGLEGADADDLGLLLVALFLAVGEGSLAVEATPTGLRRRLGDLLGGDESWVASATSAGLLSRFPRVIGDGGADARHDRHPVLLWRAVHGAEFLYFQKHLRAEQDLVQRLQERIARPNRVRDAGTIANVLREALEEQPLRSRGKAIVCDGEQLAAVKRTLVRDLVIISGGPGTGKTSVVLTALRCLARLGVPASRIALAAPTGRAAQRLSDSIRSGIRSLGDGAGDVDRSLGSLSATTLHALLDYQPARNVFRRHEENPIPADVIVIDEVSMASADHLASLLRAASPEAQVILLGDKDQLPSVDAGAALAQIVPAATSGRLAETVVILRTNHRSETGIQSAATAINAQDAETLSRWPTFNGDWASAASGCLWWPQVSATAEEIRGQVVRWAEHIYDGQLADGSTFRERTSGPAPDADDSPATHAWLARAFEGLERARLLTLVRDGAWGCGPINDVMAAWLRRTSESRREWTPGTPVLVTRNDRAHGLFNGDVGLALVGCDGQTRIAFAKQDGFFWLPPESLPSHELGFALTVHKSQGSEFQQAFVVLPPKGGRRLLTTELLYTAVTRAKTLAVVSTTQDAFRIAVGRRIVRESGMGDAFG